MLIVKRCICCITALDILKSNMELWFKMQQQNRFHMGLKLDKIIYLEPSLGAKSIFMLQNSTIILN